MKPALHLAVSWFSKDTTVSWTTTIFLTVDGLLIDVDEEGGCMVTGMWSQEFKLRMRKKVFSLCRVEPWRFSQRLLISFFNSRCNMVVFWIPRAFCDSGIFVTSFVFLEVQFNAERTITETRMVWSQRKLMFSAREHVICARACYATPAKIREGVIIAPSGARDQFSNWKKLEFFNPFGLQLWKWRMTTFKCISFYKLTYFQTFYLKQNSRLNFELDRKRTSWESAVGRVVLNSSMRGSVLWLAHALQAGFLKSENENVRIRESFSRYWTAKLGNLITEFEASQIWCF